MSFSSTKKFRKLCSLMCKFFTLHLFLNIISVHFFRIFNQTYPICQVYAHDQPWLQNLPLHWTFLRIRSSFSARITCVSMAVIIVLQSFCQIVRLPFISHCSCHSYACRQTVWWTSRWWMMESRCTLFISAWDLTFCHIYMHLTTWMFPPDWTHFTSWVV